MRDATWRWAARVGLLMVMQPAAGEAAAPGAAALGAVGEAAALGAALGATGVTGVLGVSFVYDDA